MKLYLLIVQVIALAALLVTGDDLKNNEEESRIYGGYPVDITDAPYMAHILMSENDHNNGMALSNSHECGGTIMTRRFILTAGHCE